MPALYVVRHAEPQISGVLCGQFDPPLNAAGLEMARETLSALRIPHCPIYTSPLQRAKQTACQIYPWPIIVRDLAEISYGDWDGLSWRDIEDRWPDLAAAKLSDWPRVTPPGGEPWECFRDRVQSALDRILAGPLPAIIVAHEAVNAIIGNRLVDSSIEKYKQHYCEIKKYDTSPDCKP